MVNFTFVCLRFKHFPTFLLISSCRFSTQTITFLTGDDCGGVGVGVVVAEDGARIDGVETAGDFAGVMSRMRLFVVGGCGAGVRGDSSLFVCVVVK